MKKIIIVSTGSQPGNLLNNFISEKLKDLFDINIVIISSFIENKDIGRNTSIKNLYYLLSFKEFENYIHQNCTSTHFLLHFGSFLNIKVFKVFTLYNKLKLRWIYLNLMPQINNNPINILKRIVIKKIKTNLYTIIYKTSIKPTFVASVGKLAENFYSDFGSIPIIPLLNKNIATIENIKDCNFKQDKIIYIDQNLVDHKDFKMIPNKGLKNYSYYESLVPFFKILEKQLNLPVVIAMHHSNNSNEFKNIFKEFQIDKNNTARLVKEAKLVIGHFSVALSFAVILKKSILLLQFPKKEKYLYSCVKETEKLLGIRSIKKFDKKLNLDFVLNQKINSKIYIKNIIASDLELNKDNKTRIEEIILSNKI